MRFGSDFLCALGEPNAAVGIVEDDEVGLQENVAKDCKAVIAINGSNTTNAVGAARAVLSISNEASWDGNLA